MKLLINLLFLFCFHSVCFAQKNRYNKKDSIAILDATYFSYSLDTTEKKRTTVPLPFDSIACYDVRFDTSFIAFNWQSNTNINTLWGARIFNKKYTLDSGLADNLERYFNSYYRNNFQKPNAAMICYIKKLSIKAKDTLLYVNNPHERISNIVFEAECYYKKDGLLYPAFRIDTMYVTAVYKVKQTFPELVKDIISPMMQKLENIDIIRLLNKKAYTDNQIADRYASRFELPILTDSVYRRGIYKSFEEFKNNAPSITDFNIKTKNTSVFLYDADNNIINPLHIFGFNDGAKCWLQIGSFSYPLIRVGNGFEFNYILKVIDKNGYLRVYKILLALNMDKGKVDEFTYYDSGQPD